MAFKIEETQWYKSCFVTQEKLKARAERDNVKSTYQVHHSIEEVQILFEQIFPAIGTHKVFEFYYSCHDEKWWQFEFLPLPGDDTSFARMMGMMYERFIYSKKLNEG